MPAVQILKRVAGENVKLEHYPGDSVVDISIDIYGDISRDRITTIWDTVHQMAKTLTVLGLISSFNLRVENCTVKLQFILFSEQIPGVGKVFHT